VNVGRPAAGSAGREGHAHGAGGRNGLLGDPLHLGERGLRLGLGPGELVGIEDARDTPAPGFLPLGGRGDVVGRQDGLDLDPFRVGHLGRHAEVQDVALVVAEQVEDAGAAVDCLGGREHLLDGRRGEDVADRAAVHEPLPDVSHEHRQVAGAAAGRDADLALDGRVGANDGPPVGPDELELVRVGQDDALQHFIHERERIVDDLLHERPPLCEVLPLVPVECAMDVRRMACVPRDGTCVFF